MSNGNGKQGGAARSTAIQTSSQDAFKDLRSLFEASKGRLASVLPKHLPAEKVIRLVLAAASRTPELLECSSESILLAAMQSATLGLEPNTPFQHAYLVPFRNKHTGRKEAQFIPGYRGLIQLAIQSGEIKSVHARAAYAKDHFVVRYGIDETIEHVPRLEADRGDLVAVYSVARFSSGVSTFEVMAAHEIDAVMKSSATRGAHGPWRDHFDEMAKKSVIRRHSKVMPMSAEKTEHFQRALIHQSRAEEGSAPDYGDVIDVLGPGAASPLLEGEKKDDLASRLGEKAKVEDDFPEPGSNG